MHRVSVGISFSNDERTLEAAIRSIFAQSLQEWELILVDDGSTDGSLEIARSIRDPRVRVISDGENRGLASRLNQISQLASAPYIARMDGDDIMHPERLQLQMEFLDQHPRVDVVDSACFTINAANRVLGLGQTTELDTTPRAVLRKGLLLHPACMGRREWFLRNRYDESLRRVQDLELWFRTCEQSGFERIQTPLLFYRITGAGSVWDYLRKTFRGARHHLPLVHERGVRKLGRARTYMLLARIMVFHAAALPFTLTSTQARFIHRKSRKLTPRDRAEAYAALRQVQSTHVPGFPPPTVTAPEDLAPGDRSWLSSPSGAEQ